MNSVGQALEFWVKRLALRGPLTACDRDMILDLPGVTKTYRPSQDIVQLGARATQVSLVVDGVIARFGQARSGARQLTALYIPGDMCDLHSAVLPVVSAPLQSTQGATLYRISHDDIRDVANRSPALARAFWRDCAVDGQIASEWLLNVGRRSAIAKLSHLICELACRFTAIGQPLANFSIGMTQNQLGEATGLTGVHVNRTLRLLREQGLIAASANGLKIVDWPRLVAVAEFDTAYLHLPN